MTSFQGNWVDLVIFFGLLLFVWDGWEKGIFVLVAQLGAFLSGVVVAFRVYWWLAGFLSTSFSLTRALAKPLAFLAIAVGVEELVSRGLYWLVRLIPKRYFPRWWQGLIGAPVSLVSGGVLLAVGLTFMVSLPIKPKIKRDILESKIGGLMVEKASGFEGGLGGVFGEAAQETLTFLTTPVGSGERLDLGFELEQESYQIDEEAEAAIFALVNRERLERGLPALRWFAEGVDVARAHSEDMVERGYFSHYSPEGNDVADRLETAGIEYSVAGENLALAPSVRLAHEGLMNSPGHRANILSVDFSRVAIGVVDGGIFGKMVTQIFLN